MNQLKQKQTEWITGQSVSLDFLSEEPPASLHRKVPLGDRHKTLIVIPSFNEEASLGQVLNDVKESVPELRFSLSMMVPWIELRKSPKSVGRG